MPDLHRDINIRFYAIYCLQKIFSEQQKADTVLRDVVVMGDIDARNRGLLYEIVYGVLRRYFSLEVDVSRFLSRKPPEEARLALLVGAYQLRYMRIPAHAALSETVEAVKCMPSESAQKAASMVNAVLRRITNEDAPHKLKPYQRAELPNWLYQSWRQAWGDDAVKAVAQVLQTPAMLSLVVPERDAWLAQAVALGIDAIAGELSPYAVLLPMQTDVQALPGFDEGAFWVMDQAAQWAVLALGHVHGVCLDMCSAPGGKAIFSAALHPDATIVAVERSANRLPVMQENMRRMHAENIHLLQADGMRLPLSNASVDAVLLDAPCTASGILRRHPDAKFLHTAEEPEQMSVQQWKMLAEAARVLKPGGQLIYAVCSVHAVENESVLSNLENLGLYFDTLPDALQPYAIGDGMARLLPSATHDGFFIARMRKVLD